MSDNSKTPFKPMPGYIICKPYVPKDKAFISETETAGEATVSEVLAVGCDYVDDHGNVRMSPVHVNNQGVFCTIKAGDIILHAYTPNDFINEFNHYRVVHFSQVLGVK